MDGFESPDQNSNSRTRDRDEYRSDNFRDRHESTDRRRDRDRRRSRSPAGIDRYQPDRAPRDDYRSSRNYDGARRDRRRSPHDRAPPVIDRYVPGQDQTAITINPLPDPLKLDYQVGFTWFAEWWRTEQRIKEEKERVKSGRPPRIKGERESREEREAERPKIQAAYDRYKEDLQKAQAQTFVRLHKDEDWFREKYVPEVHDVFRPKVLELRKAAYTQFEEDLANGVFDEFTLEGIYKTEANGLGGVLEKEEGETVAAAEILQTGDLLPARGGDLRDPAAQQPTLLLKTIAPTVTRESLEKLAKEHLGEGPGGFKHLSLSDPNPGKRCYRIGWYMLNSDPNQADEEMVDAGNGAEEAEEGEEVPKTSQRGGMLAIAEGALDKINGKTIEDSERGNFTIHCGVHRPPEAPRKKALWDLFSAPERVERDLDLATRLVRKYDNELGENIFGGARITARVNQLHENGSLVQPAPPKAVDNMDEVIEGGEIEEEPGAIDEDEQDDEELLVRKKQLDILVEYLRRVHNACFFCVFESDSIHELQRKCPGGHLRRPRASLTSAAKDIARASANGEPYPLKKTGASVAKAGEPGDDLDVDMAEPESPSDERSKFSKPAGKSAQQLQRAWNWVKTFEEKLLQILEPENVDLKKLGGTPVEEGLEEDLPKFVKQEDVNKYRCKVPGCTKLFKGVDFWQKHVESRHGDFHAALKTEIELVNAYVMDPAHIAPSRSDANSNGHFPNNNGMPTGTPRGFSLQSHMPIGFNPPGMPPGVFMSGQWGLGGAAMSGAGPMRSHGGRGFGNGYRSNGPYARPDGRNGRQPSFSGRSAGAFEGGVGPPQATAGRTMRSYEDLDAAAPAAKEEELDY